MQIRFVPNKVSFLFHLQKSRELISEIRDFYFKNVAIDKNAKANYIALLSDINIVYLSSKAAKMHTIESSGLAFFYQ